MNAYTREGFTHGIEEHLHPNFVARLAAKLSLSLFLSLSLAYLLRGTTLIYIYETSFFIFNLRNVNLSPCRITILSRYYFASSLRKLFS